MARTKYRMIADTELKDGTEFKKGTRFFATDEELASRFPAGSYEPVGPKQAAPTSAPADEQKKGEGKR